MRKIYSDLKEEYEGQGYMPLICLVKWSPEGRQEAIKRFCEFLPRECEEQQERKTLQGLHIWNLIGRDTMIVIAWTNSPAGLQRFCESMTFGTDITMDVCPAIDHVGLTMVLSEIEGLAPDMPVSKGRAQAAKRRKAKG